MITAKEKEKTEKEIIGVKKMITKWETISEDANRGIVHWKARLKELKQKLKS